MEWVEKWRLSSMTYNPEKVRVLVLSGTYVLIDGEDNTTYIGNLFDSPADAFIAAYADAERSISYGKRKKESLDAARARHEKSLYESSYGTTIPPTPAEREEAVSALRVALDSIDEYVIRSNEEQDDEGAPLFWSNQDGWVGRDDATLFTSHEKPYLDLPKGDCEWVRA